jgi:hypothetical protein
MKFRLEVDCNSREMGAPSALDQSTALADLLLRLADHLFTHGMPSEQPLPLLDPWGNEVGTASLVP